MEKKTQRQVGIEENNVFNLIKITTKKTKTKIKKFNLITLIVNMETLEAFPV